MTDEQRDELLISIVKGLNNLQNSFNDFRKEIKEELNTRIDSVKTEFNGRIGEVVKENQEIKKYVSDNKKSIDALVKENQEIKKYVSDNEKGIVEIVKDYNRHNYEVDKHLEKHDREIEYLKSKLA